MRAESGVSSAVQTLCQTKKEKERRKKRRKKRRKEGRKRANHPRQGTGYKGKLKKERLGMHHKEARFLRRERGGGVPLAVNAHLPLLVVVCVCEVIAFFNLHSSK